MKPLDGRSIQNVINLTPKEPTLTYVNDPMSWSLTDFPSMPITDRVDWWTWAVESGAWQVDEAGRWRANLIATRGMARGMFYCDLLNNLNSA